MIHSVIHKINSFLMEVNEEKQAFSFSINNFNSTADFVNTPEMKNMVDVEPSLHVAQVLNEPTISKTSKKRKCRRRYIYSKPKKKAKKKDEAADFVPQESTYVSFCDTFQDQKQGDNSDCSSDTIIVVDDLEEETSRETFMSGFSNIVSGILQSELLKTEPVDHTEESAVLDGFMPKHTNNEDKQCDFGSAMTTKTAPSNVFDCVFHKQIEGIPSFGSNPSRKSVKAKQKPKPKNSVLKDNDTSKAFTDASLSKDMDSIAHTQPNHNFYNKDEYTNLLSPEPCLLNSNQPQTVKRKSKPKKKTASKVSKNKKSVLTVENPLPEANIATTVCENLSKTKTKKAIASEIDDIAANTIQILSPETNVHTVSQLQPDSPNGFRTFQGTECWDQRSELISTNLVLPKKRKQKLTKKAASKIHKNATNSVETLSPARTNEINYVQPNLFHGVGYGAKETLMNTKPLLKNHPSYHRGYLDGTKSLFNSFCNSKVGVNPQKTNSQSMLPQDLSSNETRTKWLNSLSRFAHSAQSLPKNNVTESNNVFHLTESRPHSILKWPFGPNKTYKPSSSVSSDGNSSYVETVEEIPGSKTLPSDLPVGFTFSQYKSPEMFTKPVISRPQKARRGKKPSNIVSRGTIPRKSLKETAVSSEIFTSNEGAFLDKQDFFSISRESTTEVNLPVDASLKSKKKPKKRKGSSKKKKKSPKKKTELLSNQLEAYQLYEVSDVNQEICTVNSTPILQPSLDPQFDLTVRELAIQESNKIKEPPLKKSVTDEITHVRKATKEMMPILEKLLRSNAHISLQSEKTKKKPAVTKRQRKEEPETHLPLSDVVESQPEVLADNLLLTKQLKPTTATKRKSTKKRKTRKVTRKKGKTSFPPEILQKHEIVPSNLVISIKQELGCDSAASSSIEPIHFKQVNSDSSQLSEKIVITDSFEAHIPEKQSLEDELSSLVSVDVVKNRIQTSDDAQISNIELETHSNIDSSTSQNFCQKIQYPLTSEINDKITGSVNKKKDFHLLNVDAQVSGLSISSATVFIKDEPNEIPIKDKCLAAHLVPLHHEKSITTEDQVATKKSQCNIRVETIDNITENSPISYDNVQTSLTAQKKNALRNESVSDDTTNKQPELQNASLVIKKEPDDLENFPSTMHIENHSATLIRDSGNERRENLPTLNKPSTKSEVIDNSTSIVSSATSVINLQKLDIATPPILPSFTSSENVSHNFRSNQTCLTALNTETVVCSFQKRIKMEVPDLSVPICTDPNMDKVTHRESSNSTFSKHSITLINNQNIPLQKFSASNQNNSKSFISENAISPLNMSKQSSQEENNLTSSFDKKKENLIARSEVSAANEKNGEITDNLNIILKTESNLTENSNALLASVDTLNFSPDNIIKTLKLVEDQSSLLRNETNRIENFDALPTPESLASLIKGNNVLTTEVAMDDQNVMSEIISNIIENMDTLPSNEENTLFPEKSSMNEENSAEHDKLATASTSLEGEIEVLEAKSSKNNVSTPSINKLTESDQDPYIEKLNITGGSVESSFVKDYSCSSGDNKKETDTSSSFTDALSKLLSGMKKNEKIFSNSNDSDKRNSEKVDCFDTICTDNDEDFEYITNFMDVLSEFGTLTNDYSVSSAKVGVLDLDEFKTLSEQKEVIDICFDSLSNYRKNAKKYFKIPFPDAYSENFMTKSKTYSRPESFIDIPFEVVKSKLELAGSIRHNNDIVDLEDYPVSNEEVECYRRLLLSSSSEKLVPKSVDSFIDANGQRLQDRNYLLNLAGVSRNSCLKRTEVFEPSSVTNSHDQVNLLALGGVTITPTVQADISESLTVHNIGVDESISPANKLSSETVVTSALESLLNDSFLFGNGMIDLRALAGTLVPSQVQPQSNVLELSSKSMTVDNNIEENCVSLPLKEISTNSVSESDNVDCQMQSCLLPDDNFHNKLSEAHIISDLKAPSLTPTDNVQALQQETIYLDSSLNNNSSRTVVSNILEIINDTLSSINHESQSELIFQEVNSNSKSLFCNNPEIMHPKVAELTDKEVSNSAVSVCETSHTEKTINKQPLSTDDAEFISNNNVEDSETSSNLTKDMILNLIREIRVNTAQEPSVLEIGSDVGLNVPTDNISPEIPCDIFVTEGNLQQTVSDPNLDIDDVVNVDNSIKEDISIKSNCTTSNLNIDSDVNISISDLMNIMNNVQHLSSNVDNIPFMPSKVKETFDYEHRKVDSVFKEGFEFSIVHEYNHKPQNISTSENDPVVSPNAAEVSGSSLTGAHVSDLSDNEIDNEFIHADSDSAEISLEQDKDISRAVSPHSKTKDSEKFLPEPPQYKSRWEKIMERKTQENQLKGKEQLNEHFLKDVFPVTIVAKQKPIALVKPCSQKPSALTIDPNKVKNATSSTMFVSKKSKKKLKDSLLRTSNKKSKVKKKSNRETAEESLSNSSLQPLKKKLKVKNKLTKTHKMRDEETAEDSITTQTLKKKLKISNKHTETLDKIPDKETANESESSSSIEPQTKKLKIKSKPTEKHSKITLKDTKSLVRGKKQGKEFKAVVSKLPVDDSSELFSPDKLVTITEKKDSTDVGTAKRLNRKTNRGGFLTESIIETPKTYFPQKKKFKPSQSTISKPLADDLHSMITLPDIHIDTENIVKRSSKNAVIPNTPSYRHDKSQLATFSNPSQTFASNQDTFQFLKKAANLFPSSTSATSVLNVFKSSDEYQSASDPDLFPQIFKSPPMSSSSIISGTDSSIFPNQSTPQYPSQPSSHRKHGRGRQSGCVCLPPRTLKVSVGNSVFDTMYVLYLILEWNVDWLVQQQKNPEPPPITKTVYKVKNVYKDFADYYNTYFPLLMLETWQRLYVSWTHLQHSPPYFCEITSFKVHTHSISIECQVIINCAERDKGLFPEEGNVLMVKFGTKEKKGIKILGYVTDVKVSALNDSEDLSSDKIPKHNPGDPLQVLKLTFMGAYNSDDFDHSQLIRIHVLCNVKLTLRQNDALLYVQKSPLGGNLLNPSADGLRSVTMVERNSNPIRLEEQIAACVREILKGILSPHPLPLLTIVKSLPLSDRLLVLPKLVGKMKDSYKTKVLLCTRTPKSLADIGFALQDISLNIIYIGKRVDINQKLRKYHLDDAAAVKMNSDIGENKSKEYVGDLLKNAKVDILRNCDVILSLIRDCNSNLVVEAFEDQEAVAQLCCIIDEANLCSEPEILIPLMYGISKLILIGDPDVPAKVCSKAAISSGYSRSIFHRAYEMDLDSD